jgi:hypothetical protein
VIPREVGAVQVALVQLRLEARGGEHRGDVAADVAAGGDAAPNGLQARLLGAHAPRARPLGSRQTRER